MLNKFKGFLALALVLTLLPVATGINAQEPEDQVANVETVNDADALIQAINDGKSEITLGADIQLDAPLIILSPVTIDGAGHTISGTKQALWSGAYVVNVYRTQATLKNIALTNGDAGLLVNGSIVNLEGTVDVSGNAFGGIEVSQGQGVTDPAILNVNGILKNDTETEDTPTVWTVNLGEEAVVGGNLRSADHATKPEQKVFYIKEDQTVATYPVSDLQELETALASQAPHITLMDDIVLSQKLNVTYDVIIDGNHKTISGTEVEGWTGSYALQFYMVNATLKNVTLTGFDGALLVNGSSLTLEGNINVSGNEFGGIELTKGQNVTVDPELNVEHATLVNTTEDYGQPTIWSDHADAAIVGGNLFTRQNVKVDQTQYYLNEITPKEIKANTLFFEAFEGLASDKVKVNVNQVDGSLQVVLIDATVGVDDVVRVLSSVIINNEKVTGFKLGVSEVHFTATTSEADINGAVRNAVEAFLATSRSTVEVEGRAIPFALFFDVDGTEVSSRDVSVAFTSRNGGTDPVKPTEPDKDKDNTGKTDSKTPGTGIQDNMTMYASLIVMGALVLVILKSKKRYN